MIFIVSFIVLALFIVLMSLGVIFSDKPLKGSCGGLGKIMGDKCAFCDKKGECTKSKEE